MMDRLGHPPRSFRELVEADLRRAARLVARTHPDPIDPQFRIASPDGDWWIAITLTEDPTERERRLALVRDFMAWKLSPAFVLATELAEPDSVCAIGVSHREMIGCLARITRRPLSLGSIEWLDARQLGDDIPALLPRRAVTLSAARIGELEAWFGAAGRFPAVRIAPDGAAP